MGSSIISLGLGLGGGKASTASGSIPGASAFSNEASVSFDGNDDLCVIGSGFESSLNSASTLTVSLWAKLASSGGILFGSGTSTTNGLWFLPYNDSTHYFVARNASSGSLSYTAPSLNEWHHIVGVLDGSSSVVYVDGSSVATGATLPALSSDGGSDPQIGDLGAWMTFSGGSVDGLIDEVAVFSSALSASVVSDIYNSGTPTDLGSDGLDLSPLGWWRMGDVCGSSGTNIANQGSASSSDGTLTNGPTFSTDVPS